MKYSRIKDYQKKVADGNQKMKSQKVAICSIVRNCGLPLRRNIPQIEKLRKCFNESHVIIVENDSTDNTKEILEQWSQDYNNVHILSEDLGVRTVPNRVDSGASPSFSRHRMELMVSFRNKYLEYLEKNLNVDYMIVVDLDLYSFSIDGIANSFGQRIPWDVVASNGKHIRNIYKSLFGYHYYDAYALREIGDIHPLTEEIIFSYQDMLKPLKIGMPMIKVASAFNGLAIYKKEAIKGLRYFVKENDDKRVEVEVDHMPFHLEIIKKHDLFFINPSQTLYYNTYTNYIRQFPFKLMRKLFSILK